jgi:hypothetical protein
MLLDEYTQSMRQVVDLAEAGADEPLHAESARGEGARQQAEEPHADEGGDLAGRADAGGTGPAPICCAFDVVRKAY